MSVPFEAPDLYGEGADSSSHQEQRSTSLEAEQRRLDLIVELSAQGFTHKEIGRELDLSDRQVRRLVRDHGLRTEIDQRRVEAYASLCARFTGRLPQVDEVLGELLEDSDPKVKARALTVLLNVTQRMAESAQKRNEVQKEEHDDSWWIAVV